MTGRSMGLWTEDPQRLATELFRWSERLVGTDGAAIHLITERGLEARWVTETRARPGEIIQIEGTDPGPIGRTAQEGITHIVTEENQLGSEPLRSFGWRAAVCIPLRAGNRVVGVFSAGWKMPVPVSDDVRLVLEAAASLTASALHRVGLLEGIKKEQSRLREVLEWLPVIASIIDQESLTVRWANREARRMFGDIVGIDAHRTLVEGDLALFHDGTVPTSDGVRSALQGDFPLPRVRIRTRRGNWRVLESTIAPLGDGLSLVIQMDVTRDAHMEQERDRFVHMLSHHLRTPLTPVLGFVDVLTDPGLDPGTREEAVSSVKSSVGRIETVVSRLEQIASLRPVDTGAMTTQPVVEMIRQAADRAGGFGEGMLHVEGDEEALAHCAGPHVVQAVQELLSNAVIHGSPPVTVTIRGGEHTEVQIRDAGDGIPAEWERAVFSPFLNIADGYLAPSPDTLGLGLNLARALILATGGDLSYSEQAFVIRLPTPTGPRIASILSSPDETSRYRDVDHADGSR